MKRILPSIVVACSLGMPALSIAAAKSGSVVTSPWHGVQVAAAGQAIVVEQSAVPYEVLGSLSATRVSSFPLPGRTSVDLELERFSIFDDRTQFVEGTSAGDVAFPAPTISFWRGVVTDDSNSIVFLALTPDGVDNGYIRTNRRTYFLASDVGTALTGRANRHYISTTDILPVNTKPFCQVNQGTQEKSSGKLAPTGLSAPASPSDYLIDVALVGTRSFFNLTYFNDVGFLIDPWTTAGGAAEYMATLVAASNVIYERDLNTKLYLAYCRIWTSADPYTEVDSLELDDFGDWWGNNMSGSYQVISKITNTYDGGIAWVDGVCTHPYSVCGVAGHFPRPLDTYDVGNWDVIVTAHEWGHTLGSPHTHCYDPPIDKCYNCEDCNPTTCGNCSGSCYHGTEYCEVGTIMSYCDLCGSQDLSDINLTFGTRVENHIKSNLSASPCVSIPLTSSYVYKCSSIHFGTQGAPFSEIEDAIRNTANGGDIFICGVPVGGCTANGYPIPFPNGYPGTSTDAFPPGTIALPCVLKKWTDCSTRSVVIGQ